MRLLVRHGLNGKEELAIHVVDRVPAGWEIMKQLACRLGLESPFQIILYMNSTAAILPPLRASTPHDSDGRRNLLSGTNLTGPNSRALSILSDSTL